jgi:hypothetical protein
MKEKQRKTQIMERRALGRLRSSTSQKVDEGEEGRNLPTMHCHISDRSQHHE